MSLGRVQESGKNPAGTDLAGRVALVTGASSGLGARFARSLAAAGARVVLAARRADRLEACCAAIRAEGGAALAVEMDVADEASTVAAYDAAEQAFGTVDTIVANAGMNVETAAVDLEISDFDQLMAVNLRGPFLTAREGARRLIASGGREQGRGRIVLITSITAFKVDVGLAPYSASKAGLAQMGKVLARDWIRQGINVNMIAPGYIRTEINQDWFDTPQGEAQVARFPRRRLLDAADLDAALLFLCSDASRGVTGASITVDDGQSL